MNRPTAAVRRARIRSAGVAGPWQMFFRGFVKHPLMVGSIIPSSDRLIARMLAPVDWSTVKLFVEYGPGVGTFSRPILERLGGDATLIAIDTNPDFIAYLNATIADSRFVAVQGSAADVEAIVAAHGHAQADYVLSGLPFSTLPPGVGDDIAEATHRLLRTGGGFLIYQMSTRVLDHVTPRFARIERDVEWWNVPPARLFWAWK